MKPQVAFAKICVMYLAMIVSMTDVIANPLDRVPMEGVTITDGFRYFSGNTNDVNNHPTIFSFGSDKNARLVVTGPAYYREFKMSDVEGAIAAYRELLRRRGYIAR